MRPLRLPLLISALVATLLSTGQARAASAAAERVLGGTASATCAWPAAVLLYSEAGMNSSICTGSLVSPNIVVYAAHCGEDIAQIFFGEKNFTDSFTVASPARSIALPQGSCHVYPGHDIANGTDFAFCKLPEPVNDVPVVPIAMGCEEDALVAGKKVTIVGFGKDDNQSVGTKREAVVTFNTLVGNKALQGTPGHATCQGDSGGPAYVQLTDGDKLAGTPDNTWRVYGITSWGTADCSAASYNSLMSSAVPWIEATSLEDITPCTDAYGAWQPGPKCGQFPLNPGASGRNWAQACAPDERATGLSATCGAPYNSQAPKVTITAPLSASPVGQPVQVEVTATDARGGTLAKVSAIFDTEVLKPASGRTAPAYAFGPLTLKGGEHTIVVTATDAHGVSTVVTQKMRVASYLDGASTGGCTTGPGAFVWLVVLGFVAWRHRGVRNMALVLVAVVASTSCAGNSIDAALAQGGGVIITSTTATNGVPPPQSAVLAAVADTPGMKAEMTGMVTGASFTPVAANFAIFPNYGQPGVMQIDISNTTTVCEDMLTNVSRKAFKGLRIYLVTLEAGEDAPINGTFQVTTIASLNMQTSGRWAMAEMVANDTACTNQLSAAASAVTAGEVVLETHVTTGGSYITGTFKDLKVGTDGLNGSFTGIGCSLLDVVQARATCR